MSVITIPSGILVNRQEFGVQDFSLEFTGGDSGASQVAVNGPSRWTCSLTSNELLDDDESARWRAMILALKGRVNFLAVHDILSPQPRGTVRGTLTASGTTAAGASTMTITGGVSQANRTLLRGDWLGVNQGGTNRQLLHVQEDATANASGVITVTFEPSLRVAVTSGTAVAWDKPTCLMRRNQAASSWSSSGAVQGGFNLDLMEAWF